MSVDVKEKRMYARLSMKTEIRFSVDSQAVDAVEWTSSEDISLRGIRFLSTFAVPRGSTLTIVLFLPNKADPLEVKAKSRWCTKAPQEEGFWIGVEFLHENPTLRYLLLKYVCGNWGEDFEPIVY